MNRLLMIGLLVLFMVALARLVAEGEWYLVASLISGIMFAREDIRKLLMEKEEQEEKKGE